MAAGAEALGIPAVILRYANVYGSRQRAGPYAGVATTFFEQLSASRSPIVHEDGRQTRDFVHVSDVVRATLQALEADAEEALVANIGTGKPTTIAELAEVMSELTDRDLVPTVAGTHRAGDIRHLWVDRRRSEFALNFTPAIDLQEGLRKTFSAER